MATLANITVKPVKVLWNSVDLGFTEGDIELTTEEQAVDITSHQTGTNVLDAIRTGVNVSLSLTLKETSDAQLQTLIELAGGSVTPGGGTKVSGWGISKQFTGQAADSAALILHPVVNADDDFLQDVVFWKAYPMVESIVHSGENPRTVSVTFKIFPDDTRAAELQFFGYGDHSQDGLEAE